MLLNCHSPKYSSCKYVRKRLWVLWIFPKIEQENLNATSEEYKVQLIMESAFTKWCQMPSFPNLESKNPAYSHIIRLSEKFHKPKAYYSRQLYTYNFTIVMGSSKSKLTLENVFIYIWMEHKFAKSSSQICSAAFDLLNKVVHFWCTKILCWWIWGIKPQLHNGSYVLQLNNEYRSPKYKNNWTDFFRATIFPSATGQCVWKNRKHLKKRSDNNLSSKVHWLI